MEQSPIRFAARARPGLPGVAAIVAALSGTPTNAQWTVTALHPNGFYLSRVYAVSATQQFGEIGTTSVAAYPTIWNGTATSWSNLAPTGFGGNVLGVFGTGQVGDLGGRAALWYGTVGSYVNLNVQGWSFSRARAAWGNEQGGSYDDPATGNPKAVIWHGTAESWVSLHPPAEAASSVSGVGTGRQAGTVWSPSTGSRAAMWTGTAESLQILHPGPEFAESSIGGMVDGQVVGWARHPGENPRAALWSETAASYVDLNPAIAGNSQLYATCGLAQVGWAGTNQFGFTAGIWFGTAESFIPLAPYLPPGYGQSIATSVAFDGSTFFVGGYARNLTTNNDEAFLWTGVPAPGSLAVLLGAGLIAARRRRAHAAVG